MGKWGLLILISAGIYILFILIKLAFLKRKHSKIADKESFASFLKKDNDFKGFLIVLPIFLIACSVHYSFDHSSVYKIIMSALLLILGVSFLIQSVKGKFSKNENGQDDLDEKIEWKKIALPIFVLSLTLIFFTKSVQNVTGSYFKYLSLFWGLIVGVSYVGKLFLKRKAL